jgi:tRNA threonylcarbamoyl adenosine modification protein (Sua5/YciO/YrdC/YwlC family)
VTVTYDCTKPADRDRGLDEAADVVRAGGLVVLPTDTVYGIGGDAFTRWAVKALLDAKGRGREMPPPVLVASWTGIDGLMLTIPQQVRDLVEAFWPGPLTLIVEHSPSLDWDLGDTAGTVGLRMPMHPVAIELLERTGPMAVSSANKSGQPAATTCEDAKAQLGESVDVYLDAGPTPGALPSTIVDTTATPMRILRKGALDPETLRTVIPDLQG